jgi:glucose/arabinose dehydrogenase
MQLNHGLALSQDGKTLYASSSEAAYSWSYDSTSSVASKANTTLVTGMKTDDHTTRTLLMSQKVNGTLLISRGSTSNIDLEAEMLSSGHSQIKAFNLNNITANGYDFDTDGLRLGWGLRNSVGVSEHPATGGIYSVENSVDQATRDGQDVHEDNPGEEMNFHGYLNGTKYAPQGSNYGYPYCFAAWVPSDLPMNSNVTVGSQFAIGSQNNTINDTYCAEQTPPRLTFQAHMAPLDIKFNNSGNDGWVTFHGSWDRTDPSGYKVSTIQFADGEPVAAANSNTSYTDIFTNADNSACPGSCFRPVSMAFDSQGRMFVSSDASGEIYVVTRDEASNGISGGSASSGTSGSSSAGGKTSGAEKLWVGGTAALAITFLVSCVMSRY